MEEAGKENDEDPTAADEVEEAEGNWKRLPPKPTEGLRTRTTSPLRKGTRMLSLKNCRRALLPRKSDDDMVSALPSARASL